MPTNPISTNDRIQDLVLDEIFSFDQLQSLHYLGGRLQEAINILAQNKKVLEELKQYFQDIIESKDFLSFVNLQDCLEDVAGFFRGIDKITREMDGHQARLQATLHDLEKNIVFFNAILEYRNTRLGELGQELAMQAKVSTDSMHVMTIKARREAVSMHIITIWTLVFLPGTFVAATAKGKSILLVASILVMAQSDTPIEDQTLNPTAETPPSIQADFLNLTPTEDQTQDLMDETPPFVQEHPLNPNSAPTDEFVEFVQRKKNEYRGRDGSGMEQHYIPHTELLTYWTDARIQDVCESYAEGIVTSLDLIREQYIRVFSTLVYTGNLSYIPAFQKNELWDQRLPATTLPGPWEQLPSYQAMFDDFKSHQWTFFPVILDRYSLDDTWLPPERILPICAQATIREQLHSDRAAITKIQFHPSCNSLLKSDGTSTAHPSYILKTYHGQQHKQHYRHEVQAFARLLQNPTSLEHVVKCYATFQHGETYNLVMEWVAGGDLLQYLQKRRPPRTSEDILDFWESLSKLTLGLHRIHQVIPSGESAHQYQLVHQDIKPDNILLDIRSRSRPYQFSPIIADLGHSSIRDIGADTSDIPAVYRRGNQIYCAPESIHHSGIRRIGPRGIKWDADIFSAGALFSDAASWVAEGEDGRKRYFHRRREELESIKGFANSGYENAFHDGFERLASVDEMHRDIRRIVPSHDRMTPRVLDIIENHMLVSHKDRLQANLLYSKFEKEIQDAKAELALPPTSAKHIPQVSEDPLRNTLEAGSILSMQDAADWRKAMKLEGHVSSTQKKMIEELIESLGRRDLLIFIDDTESMREHSVQIEVAFQTLAYIAKTMDPDDVELSFASKPLDVIKSRKTTVLLEEVKLHLRNHVSVKGSIESSLSTLINEKIVERLPVSIPLTGQVPAWYKPITIFVFTDGKWGDGLQDGNGPTVPISKLMQEMKNRGLNRTHVMFQFIRFGDDEKGRQHLEYLDDFGKEEEWDIVDTQHIHGDMYNTFLAALTDDDVTVASEKMSEIGELGLAIPKDKSSKEEASRFVDNNRRLLKLFYLEIAREVQTAPQAEAASFLKSRRRRKAISSDIFQTMIPDDGTSVPLVQEEEDLSRLDQYLDTLVDRQATDQTMGDEQEGSSDDDSETGLGLLEPSPGASLLQATGDFLVTSQAFASYKQRFHDFIRPSHRKKQETSGPLARSATTPDPQLSFFHGNTDGIVESELGFSEKEALRDEVPVNDGYENQDEGLSGTFFIYLARCRQWLVCSHNSNIDEGQNMDN
ncbi:hypothetical protein INS49_010744 [Diaporthe citri]|uniref:uncharacterized protein n=1 Tax=Diaporthe citri TaxID=83186 RepID=UPI001C818B95|nr:uncharacterized protein INS49_010744 [Diaporthe citri]KAG6359692.1 hypothetical protein INS49_010744 [Diaporthe citri]